MIHRHFQAVYVENAAFTHDLTRQIIARLPECPVIPIRHYKDVFNRSNQDVRWQKAHQSLILAVKDKPHVYPGPRICQHFGHDHFYYSNIMLGCPFDCSYCYLQGLYPSAHLVVFVNLPDFALSYTELSAEPVYLALSHDTDMLAYNWLVPCLDLLTDLLSPRLPLLAEIRTKSASSDYFVRHEPFPLFIFAFTLAPDEVICRYERHTPSLDARLAAVQAALAHGHAVRLCFDPVLIDPAIDAAYLAFFHLLFQRIDPAQIADISYGFFRMADPLYRRIARIRPGSLLFQDMVLDQNNNRSYDSQMRKSVSARHLKLLRNWISPDKIFLA